MITANPLPFSRWECTDCGACFDSLNAFKMHRAEVAREDHVVTLARCLNAHEMKSAGLRRDETGFWRGTHTKR
jgi:hypothetical protein